MTFIVTLLFCFLMFSKGVNIANQDDLKSYSRPINHEVQQWIENINNDNYRKTFYESYVEPSIDKIQYYEQELKVIMKSPVKHLREQISENQKTIINMSLNYVYTTGCSFVNNRFGYVAEGSILEKIICKLIVPRIMSSFHDITE